MIDLHCHILPGIDDGAKTLEQALEMARIAEQDGITHTACTPHAYPGVYENEAKGIFAAVSSLQQHINDSGIKLKLTHGADTHLVPNMLSN
ncbi:capsular biosynthesis protein, partial [Achromatium sp. WMS2]